MLLRNDVIWFKKFVAKNVTNLTLKRVFYVSFTDRKHLATDYRLLISSICILTSTVDDGSANVMCNELRGLHEQHVESRAREVCIRQHGDAHCAGAGQLQAGNGGPDGPDS